MPLGFYIILEETNNTTNVIGILIYSDNSFELGWIL